MPPVAKHPSKGPARCAATSLEAQPVPLPRFGFGEDQNNSPSFAFILGEERNAYAQTQFHIARMSVSHRRAPVRQSLPCGGAEQGRAGGTGRRARGQPPLPADGVVVASAAFRPLVFPSLYLSAQRAACLAVPGSVLARRPYRNAVFFHLQSFQALCLVTAVMDEDRYNFLHKHRRAFGGNMLTSDNSCNFTGVCI